MGDVLPAASSTSQPSNATRTEIAPDPHVLGEILAQSPGATKVRAYQTIDGQMTAYDYTWRSGANICNQGADQSNHDLTGAMACVEAG
jgi:hypothetical protein